MKSSKIESTDIPFYVFLISLLIFVLTILPAVQVTGGFLIGVAGGDPVTNPPPVVLTDFERWLSIISGIVTVVSGLFGIQKTRAEFASLKKKELEKELQLREIEKLKLELELEKFRKNKVKSKKAKNK